MKKKQLALLLLPLILSGCGNSTSTPNTEKTFVLNAGFVFDHKQAASGEKLASLLFDGSYYSFFDELTLEEPLVAGDQLNVTIGNITEDFCLSLYPARCTVNGEIKTYTHIKTEIVGVGVDDGTIGENARTIRESYILDNEKVILDKEGRFVPLEDYDGQRIYLSVNKNKTETSCSCPEGAQCEPCPLFIAGLYAYNPRPSE